jgi:hypothetical protein
VGCGPAGADDGGAAAVEGGADGGLVTAVGPVVVAGAAGLVVGAAVVVGAVEVLVGAGAGGPKQPVRMTRALKVRTLKAESLGLVMMLLGVLTLDSGAYFEATPELPSGTGT